MPRSQTSGPPYRSPPPHGPEDKQTWSAEVITCVVYAVVYIPKPRDAAATTSRLVMPVELEVAHTVPAAAGWSSPPDGFVCTDNEPRWGGCSGQSALPGWHWGGAAGETGPSQRCAQGWSAPLLQVCVVCVVGGGWQRSETQDTG